MFVIGSANSAWFKRLKASTRISRWSLSVIAVAFTSDMSRFVLPGPRNNARDAVPYVSSDGFAMTCAVEGKHVGEGTAQGSVKDPTCAVVNTAGLK